MQLKRTPWNKGLKGYLAGEKHWNFGKKWSAEIKQKMSENRKGKAIGENHPQWKGELVGYRAIHDWVVFRLGKANKCSFNIIHKSTRYHWANVSGSYLRDLGDWIQLCPSCHKQYDKLLNHPATNIFLFKNAHYSVRKVGYQN